MKADLYDRNFAEWAPRNAGLLRSGGVVEADLDHIVEGIEDMAGRERRALESLLARLIQHLLKWQVRPMKRNAGRQATTAEQRIRTRKLLEENPSFRPGSSGDARHLSRPCTILRVVAVYHRADVRQALSSAVASLTRGSSDAAYEHASCFLRDCVPTRYGRSSQRGQSEPRSA